MKMGDLQSKLPEGIRRLNKYPLFFGGGILSLVLVIVIYSIGAAGDKGNKDLNDSIAIQKDSNSSTDIDALLKPPMLDFNETDLNTTNFNSVETNQTMAPTSQLTPAEEEAMRMIAQKMKMANDALYSPTRLDNSQGNTQNPISNAVGDVVDVISGLANAAGASASSSAQKPEKDTNVEFVENSKKSYDYLPYTKTSQLSFYEIKTGSVIPGVLVTGINSQLPGNIVGQVSENVYDSATGKHLLIPQGSKLVGTYNPDVKYGQNRAMIAWNRIVYPNGDTLNLEAMIGSDQAGYSGFDDKVDNHYFRIFGSALLISVISGELTFSNNKIAINDNPNSQGTTVSQTGNTLLEKNLEVDPTIEIRPGYRFNIFVTKDISFKK